MYSTSKSIRKAKTSTKPVWSASEVRRVLPKFNGEFLVQYINVKISVKIRLVFFPRV